jgi:integrase
MQAKLTKKLVDGLKPQATRFNVTDSEFPGLTLRVTPSGAKSFYFVYRHGTGRTSQKRWVRIGAFPATTCELARQEAKRLAAMVVQGNDPAGGVKEEKQAQRVAEVLEIFFTNHVQAHRKPKTIHDYRYILDHYLIPRIGMHKIKDVTSRHVEQMHLAMRGTPTSANRSLAVASKFFNWCEQRGFRDEHTNPCRHVEKYPEHKRERQLTGDELFRLGNALAECEAAGTVSQHMAAAFRLLLFTGARRNEIFSLKWSYLDLDAGLARLPDSKTGPKTIHLPAPALEVLQGLPRVAEYVFPSTDMQGRPTHTAWPEKAWRRVLKVAGLDGLRLHDLRHAFASVAVTSGQSLPMIGAMLGHSQPATTARYAHLAQNPVHEAAEDTAGRIATAMNGGGGKVVRFKKRAG